MPKGFWMKQWGLYFLSIWSRKLQCSPGSARCFSIQTAMSKLLKPAVYPISKGLSLCLFTSAAGRFVAAYLSHNRQISGSFKQSCPFEQRRQKTVWKASYPLSRRSGKEWETEEQSDTKTAKPILLFIPAQAPFFPSSRHLSQRGVFLSSARTLWNVQTFIQGEGTGRKLSLRPRLLWSELDKTQFAASGCPVTAEQHRLLLPSTTSPRGPFITLGFCIQ